MKKLYIFALVAMLFAACTTDETQDVAVNIEAPDTLVGTFEGDDSRIQLNEAQKTVWTKDDLVSVFYRSNANQKWQYQGETGERTGNLKRVANAEGTQELSNIVVVYPYNENYYINPKTNNVQASLPAVQTYLKDSYGLDGNIMVSQSEYNQFSLKNVCGWLKIQLTGNGEKVQSIKLKGNNGEQVAGEIYINSADATSTLASEMGGADDGENSAGGNLVFDDTILTEVVLNCGEGVTLSSEATAFYIALPPQTFSKGLTVKVECQHYTKFVKSTNNAVSIQRNAIQPMSAFAFGGERIQQNNEIFYTSSDGKIVTPYRTDVFGANIVSNTYKNGMGVITFDAPVTSIGFGAFAYCYALKSINIPNSIIKIDQEAFWHSGLETITILDSVTSIGPAAFESCGSLTSVTIGNSVTSIGSCTFDSCTSLTRVDITDLSAWCKISFGDFYANPLNNGAKLYLNGSELTDITIPSDITEIKQDAFSGCTSLTSVTIGKRVTSIGKSAFYRCTSLTTITIPDSVTSIGKYAFEGCTSLTAITIPESVTKIGGAAFRKCTLLTTFTVPNSVTEIEGYVFEDCTSLTSITIPDSVTSIGNYAFEDCTSLTSITIPESVTEIGGAAFKQCSSLKEVYCKATTPPAGGSNMFYSNASDRKIYVPRESVEAYKSAEYWSDYASDIEGYEF